MNGRIMLLSKFAVCNSKKTKFIEEQKAKRLLGGLPRAKITILGDTLLISKYFILKI